MASDLWLVVLIGLSGAVLAGLVALVVFARKRGTSRDVSSLLRPASPPPPSSAGLARGAARLYGPVAPSRARSVSGNVNRAFDRIDAIDPYAAPRRIGEAMSQVGLMPPLALETDGERVQRTVDESENGKGQWTPLGG